MINKKGNYTHTHTHTHTRARCMYTNGGNVTTIRIRPFLWNTTAIKIWWKRKLFCVRRWKEEKTPRHTAALHCVYTLWSSLSSSSSSTATTRRRSICLNHIKCDYRFDVYYTCWRVRQHHVVLQKGIVFCCTRDPRPLPFSLSPHVRHVLRSKDIHR